MIKQEWTSTVDPLKNKTNEFVIRYTKDQLVTGALWIPKEHKKDTLITFGHGASGDRYQRPIPQLASKLTKLGYTVMAIDGPVHGLRQVGPGGLEAMVKLMASVGSKRIISRMITDWNIAIETSAKKAFINIKRFAYFGLSMGSWFGIPMLADRYKNGLPVTVATLGLVGINGALEQDRSRLIIDAKLISCPILFLMQLEDELFSRDGYFEIFDSIVSNDKRLHANPGLHPQIPTEEIDFSLTFIKEYLEGRKKGVINPISG